MKTLILTLGFFLFFTGAYAENPTESEIFSKNNIVKGKVVDATSGEALTGVEIIILGTEKVVYTDFEGEFEVKDIPSGEYAIQINYISYKKKIIRGLTPGKNRDVTIKLISTQPMARSKSTDRLPIA